jgi:hypothetical protein
MTLLLTDTGTAEGNEMPVRFKWSPGDIAAWLTILLTLIGSMLFFAGRLTTAENRIGQLEKVQEQQAAIINTLPDRLARMETKIDILREERKK